MQDIDGDALARTPLEEIESAINGTPAGSTLRQSLRAVIGVLAVQLVAGTVPVGMDAADAFRKGRELLMLLHGREK
ncbi:MAG TPA: hypothetical protein VJ577_16640 [Burkholderiaceae bacterium]|nr:hypothetical protein [Burkholderiaceae bacterium]